jgi:hypothetical protein
VTVTSANNFFQGQPVVITGLTGSLAGYNGTFTVATATTTTFTVPLASAGVPSTATTTGTATPIELVLAVPPYTVNGNSYNPALGTNPLYEPLSTAPVFTTLPVNGQQVTDMLNEIYYDELNQLVNLQALINGQIPGSVTASGAIPRPAMDILGKNSTSTTLTTLTPQKALAQARLLEDLSVTAFAGVAAYLTGSNLTAVSQILAVDGLHAGAIRLAIIQQNAATPGTIIDLVSDSGIVPAAAGAFWQVQADDVAPVDTGVANVGLGPQVVTTPVVFSSTEGVTNPCTAPVVPFLFQATITNVTATATTVTVVAANNFSGTQAGVVINGLTGALAIYNGTFTLASASATGFTFAFAGTAVASTPVTPGTAFALAASDTTCTPTQYQGFFATAGAGTASGSTPAGFAFARTTSQVLSVLYASAPGAPPASPPLPSPNTNPLGANSLEYQGGFFPTGVLGPINAIVS